jgi:cytidylate kinase
METKINIAIDGYSSSGKSSLARAISKEFEMKYIDTGAMYRSITYLLLKNSIDSSNFKESEKKIEEIINNCNIEYNYNFKKNFSETILNGNRCDEHIRKNYVSEFVSIVSKSKKVRDFMIAKQKKIASNKNVVMDGRDIGTVVIYDAEIKFFIEADLHIRAKRRFDQAQDESLTIKKVIENLNFRDNEDMLRENSPLKKAKDSIVLNNTNINFEELKNQAFDIIRKKNENHN